EQRMSATDVSPAQAQATVQRLLASVTDANALGDLAGLKARLEGLTSAVDHRREEVKAAREHARAEAKGVKERIVEEAEHIAATATHGMPRTSSSPPAPTCSPPRSRSCASTPPPRRNC